MGRNENRFNRFGFTIRLDIPTVNTRSDAVFEVKSGLVRRTRLSSQGCSSGSGNFTHSVKVTLQHANILVVERKLERDPISDPGYWPL